jgi:hypothetical protein
MSNPWPLFSRPKSQRDVLRYEHERSMQHKQGKSLRRLSPSPRIQADEACSWQHRPGHGNKPFSQGTSLGNLPPPPLIKEDKAHSSQRRPQHGREPLSTPLKAGNPHTAPASNHPDIGLWNPASRSVQRPWNGEIPPTFAGWTQAS